MSNDPQKATAGSAAEEPKPQAADNRNNVSAGSPTAEDAILPDQSVKSVTQNGRTIVNQVGGVVSLFADGGRTYRTDRLDGAEVGRRLKRFVASPSFERARSILDTRGFVILVGSEGTGRFLAALALLAQWPNIRLVSAIERHDSDIPLVDLVQKVEESARKPGVRHVVHEVEGLDTSTPKQRLAIDRLQTTLLRAGARLVLTVERRSIVQKDFGDVVVDWTPPDGGALFDAYYPTCAAALAPPELAKARAFAVTLSRPGQVLVFLGQLSDGLDAAIAAHVDAHEEVRAWFDSPGRSLADQLVVAAACFLAGTPERVFERWLDRLRRLVRDHDKEERAPLSQPLTLDQDRRLWTEGSELLTTRQGSGRFAERRIVFRQANLRQQAVQAIWDRYGYALLGPMRTWIGELVADDNEDVRFQTAVGLALLAERRWPEVKESFLLPWSVSDTFARRLAAANVLTVMVVSNRLAPLAIETALSWAEESGTLRSTTGVFALGGPLGLRYRNRAFEMIWYLTRKGGSVAAAANVALVVMLATAASTDDPEIGSGENVRAVEAAEAEENRAAMQRAVSLLAVLRDAMVWTRKRGDGWERRRALDCVAGALGVERFSDEGLVLDLVLRAEPAALPVVGELLAGVLESGPHHHRGVRVLRGLLSGFSTDDAALAQALGAAVFGCWGPDTQSVQIPQIERELALPVGSSRSKSGSAEVPRQVFRSFVDSVGRN